jgi:antitoxin Phd
LSVVYTYSKAREKLASILEQAVREGEVRIVRKDGQVFVIRPETRRESPLDVDYVDLSITRDEIIEFIREGRREYS